MAIELIQKEQKQAEPKTYRIGDTFKLHDENDAYILVTVAQKLVQLICINDGERWHHPVPVSEGKKITQKEFDKLTGGKSSDFIPTDYQLIEI